jgi:hypothetical protein
MSDAPPKESFFERLGALSDEMIAAYGRDFTMGALIIAARFIAQGQPVASALTEAVAANNENGVGSG